MQTITVADDSLLRDEEEAFNLKGLQKARKPEKEIIQVVDKPKH